MRFKRRSGRREIQILDHLEKETLFNFIEGKDQFSLTTIPNGIGQLRECKRRSRGSPGEPLRDVRLEVLALLDSNND